MFIKYTLEDQLLVSVPDYTANTSKAVKKLVFQKYLYKITKYGLCVGVDGIEIVDNIILRKTAEMKIKIIVVVLVLNLLDDQYFEGQVSSCEEDGVRVLFMNKLLEGKISIIDLHNDTHYCEETKEWIMTTSKSNEECYKWKVGANARFKVKSAKWQNVEAKEIHELISLKANEPGLGPADWWI